MATCAGTEVKVTGAKLEGMDPHGSGQDSLAVAHPVKSSPPRLCGAPLVRCGPSALLRGWQSSTCSQGHGDAGLMPPCQVAVWSWVSRFPFALASLLLL